MLFGNTIHCLIPIQRENTLLPLLLGMLGPAVATSIEPLHMTSGPA